MVGYQANQTVRDLPATRSVSTENQKALGKDVKARSLDDYIKSNCEWRRDCTLEFERIEPLPLGSCWGCSESATHKVVIREKGVVTCTEPCCEVCGFHIELYSDEDFRKECLDTKGI